MNTAGLYTRTERCDIQDCPLCHKHHEYDVAVTVQKGLAHFGGKTADRSYDVEFVCPTTGENFIHKFKVAEATDERIQSVGMADTQTDTPDWLRNERSEWLKNSVAAGRSFAQMMMTTSSAAIPIYFTLLKYLSPESQKVPEWLGIIPPVLFLISVGAFAFALRPTFSLIYSDEEFLIFRNKRLNQLNQRTQNALIVFALAITVTVVVFALGI